MHTSPFGKTATISATISAQSSILLLAHWVLSVRSAVVLMADGLRTVRVPHLTLEHHLGRVQWIVVRERDGRCEETSLVRRIRRAPCKQDKHRASSLVTRSRGKGATGLQAGSREQHLHDVRLPLEEVVLRHWTSSDAFGRLCREFCT